MTTEQKRLSLIIAAVVFVLVIIWFLRRGANTVYTGQNANSGDIVLGDVTVPGLVMDPAHISFSIPAFGLPADQFSMISGCCSDCSSKSAPISGYKPSRPVELVFNAPDRGGNVYNYYSAPTPDYILYAGNWGQ